MTESESGAHDETPQDETPQDETKRKFREALERKKAKSAGGASHRRRGQAVPFARPAGEPPGVPPQERLNGGQNADGRTSR